MTAELKHIDPALDRALSSSPEPMAPAGLAGRITEQATAKPQRKATGLLRSRRTRPERSRGRRPVLMGAIGGGLLAVSAVAAALVSEGYVDLGHLTRPVVALFSPERDMPPIETAAPRAEPVRQQTAAPSAEPTATEVIQTDRGVQPAANQQRLTPWQRAVVVRRALMRRRALRAEAGLPVATPRQRAIERRVMRRAVRRQAVANRIAQPQPTDGSRIREAVRTGRITPEQGERLDTLRQRRNEMIEAGATPQQIRAGRRERVREIIRNRRDTATSQQPPVRPAVTPDTPPAGSPFRPLPVEGAQAPGVDVPSQPAPNRLAPDRSNLPPPEIMGPDAASPAALPDRPPAATRAERIRRARQRRANQRPRPRRPRIPRRRR